MTSITIDEINSIPKQELNDDIIINELLSTNIPQQLSIENVNEQSLSNEILSITLIRDPQLTNYCQRGNINDISEYTIWSICNLFFSFTYLGIIALGLSRKTTKMKQRGQYLNAQNDSHTTALVNIITTLSAILFYLLGGLRLSGHLVIKSSSSTTLLD